MFVVDEGTVGPQLPRDFLSRQQFAGALQKHEEHLKGLHVHFNADTLLAKLSRCRVCFKHSEAIASSLPWVRHVFGPVYLIRARFEDIVEGTTPHIINRCSHLLREKQSSPGEPPCLASKT